jgi:cell division protein FtsI/penicillin-binding protein 2
MSRRVLKSHPDEIFKDPLNEEVNMPWLDRAIARPYPPGSIVKALILNGAVKFGRHNLDTPIDCTGHLFPDKPNEFRCWIYKDPRFRSTHTEKLGHPLSAPEGLMVSCNIYFFTLGQKLGPQGIIDTYSMFGLGQKMDLGLGIEYKGGIGVQGDGEGISIQDAIQMGIGQGPVTWTPLHAADAYATLARGGKRIRPHIVDEPSSRQTEDLGLDPRAIKEALEGLSMSVNDERGTGNHVDIPRPGGGQDDRVFHFKDLPNIKVWGKTGTAQAPTIFTQATKKDPATGKEVADPLYEKSIEAEPIREASHDPKLQFPAGRRALRWGDHSWFVVLVGHQDDQKPLYAISVMMEYAGSGGKVSGPIVAQIIRALETEGYL